MERLEMELGRCREKLHDVDFYKARMEVSPAARPAPGLWRAGLSAPACRRSPKGFSLRGRKGAGAGRP